jgi:hypothetical protein
MQLVIESRQARGHWCSHFRCLMALQTDLRLGQQIVIDTRARKRRGVAHGTLQLRRQVDAVRERLCDRRGGECNREKRIRN